MSILIYISVIPVILLLLYIYNKDVNKEPKELLKRIFKWGLVSFIPIVICEGIFTIFFDVYDNSNYVKLFFTTFFGIGLIEEFFKWLVVYKITYNSKEFDEVYDAIVYSVCSSLGFACIENILYIITGGFSTGILRAFTAVPVHTCDGIVMGYYLGIAKKNNKNNYLMLSLLMPVIAHTIYDFLLLTKNIYFILIWFISYIIFVIICVIIVKRVSNRKERIVEEVSNDNINIFFNINNENRYCANCGRECNSNYCPNCGYKNN